MNYFDLMNAFSVINHGVILGSSDGTILDMNQAALRFLDLNAVPKGEKLENIAPFLSDEAGDAEMWNPSFGLYLKRCPAPQVPSLPPQTQLFVFRDASVDFKLRLLSNTINHMSDAVTIWDQDARMLMINNAAERLETHLSQEVIGKNVSEL